MFCEIIITFFKSICMLFFHVFPYANSMALFPCHTHASKYVFRSVFFNLNPLLFSDLSKHISKTVFFL